MVELTVTLALVGLLTALVLPAFVQMGDRLERERFLELLAEDVRLAQREARARETETFLQVEGEGTSYSVYRGNSRLRREKVPGKMRLESNYPSGRLVFRKSGQIRGGTVRLMDGGKPAGKVVVQVASGRPRVEVVP
ncbi:type II secretory pathway pseudopilin PulG [Melghirimyces profundicolus]|uniref:Type II secretory pathway pseudopilin PulG n=1 Tax=Melghirimyces profundicolus TaxID=1242148 RepID=A0A2T6C9M7_9BACL|nr:type II secretion system protein [Melghirimyces profundicolus]PTX65024.1 type II secretory pathway pseudopilin PulG [Melghirimyces profundicolus]